MGELGLGVPDTSIRTATTPNLASDDQQPRAVAKALLIETEPSRDELWRNVEGKEAIRGDVRNKVSFCPFLGGKRSGPAKSLLHSFSVLSCGFLVMFPRPHDPPGISWLFPAAATSASPRRSPFNIPFLGRS